MTPPILQAPNDLLLLKSVPVELPISAEVCIIAGRLIEAMHANNGAGLSAPQIGLLLRLIVLNWKPEPLVMFNPVIVKCSPETATRNEGCLSIDHGNRMVPVTRNEWVAVQYRDLDGDECMGFFDYIPARVIQHEIDHLDGKLIA